MNKKLLVSAIALGLVGCNSSNSDTIYKAPFERFSMSIAHVNDTHSSFDEVKAAIWSDFLRDGDHVYTAFGGHPRLLEAANEYKQQAEEENRSMLFLHGGDAWQGTAYFKLNNGKMNADILSRMGLDAMAMGNHEFDLDNETLAEFLNTVNFPVLGANMDTSEDEALRDIDNLLPYTLFAFEGNKKEEVTLDNLPRDKQVVAVVGVVLEDMAQISPNVGDVRFQSEIETTQKVVDELKANGINKIILLTHLGLQRDINIAENVNGVDVIVGGHSHTLMGDFTNIGWAEETPYAYMVTNPDGGQTCVVQSGEKAQAIGHANVNFNRDGSVSSCSGGNTILSSDTFYSDSRREDSSMLTGNDEAEVVAFIDGEANIAITDEDQALRERIDTRYKPELEAAYGDVITYVAEDLVHERRPNDGGTDEHGSRVAPIVGEGWLHWANQAEVLAATGFAQVDVALVGAGGVRNSLEQGDLREGEISLELLPFANYLSVLKVEGSVLRQLIDETVTASLLDSAHMGKFPYTAGLRYTFDETLAQVDGEISQLQIRRVDGSGNVTWEDVIDANEYIITTTNYNANGNDDWTALYQAQESGVERYEIVLDGNNVDAYRVTAMTTVGDSYRPIYADGNGPDCSDDSALTCNTDALGVIEYLDSEVDVLEEVEHPPVTLNLLPRS